MHVLDLSTGKRTQKILGESYGLGFSVSVARNGVRLAAAGYSDGNGGGGYVRVYERDGDDGDNVRAGPTIYVLYPFLRLSGDGTRLLVGSPDNDSYSENTGKAFLYNVAVWTTFFFLLEVDNGGDDDRSVEDDYFEVEASTSVSGKSARQTLHHHFFSSSGKKHHSLSTCCNQW